MKGTEFYIEFLGGINKLANKTCTISLQTYTHWKGYSEIDKKLGGCIVNLTQLIIYQMKVSDHSDHCLKIMYKQLQYL